MTSGKVVPLKAILTPIFGPTASVIGGIGFYEDTSESKLAESKLHYQFQFEKIIATISSSFVNNTEKNIDAIIINALKLTCQFFDADRCYIFQINPDGVTASNTYEWEEPGIASIMHKYQNLPLSSLQGMGGFIDRLMDHIHIPDIKNYPPELESVRHILTAGEVKSLLVLPLISDKKVSGCFGYDCLSKARSWTYEEITLLKVIGEIFSSAFAKQAAEKKLQESQASLLGKLQKYDNAETLLEKGLASYPTSISLMYLAGLIKFRKGDKESAKTIFTNVLQLDGGNAFAKKWLETVNQGNEMPMDETDNESAALAPGEPATGDAGEYKVSMSLSKDEQHELAVKLYQQMMELEKWELDQFISLHREVIEKCLYLLGQDPPDYENVVAVLEHLLKQYPETDLLPDAKNRLMVVYGKMGRSDRLVSLYEELFTRDPEPKDDKTYMVRALEYAEALSAVGRTADAQQWYQKVIEKDNGHDNLEARVARDRLSGK
jgi:tetratricopeptide (TPR) repeat protein